MVLGGASELELFQSTPPRGRRPCPVLLIGEDELFQSTPPRGRRRGLMSEPALCVIVSIHASAREATDHRGRV